MEKISMNTPYSNDRDPRGAIDVDGNCKQCGEAVVVGTAAVEMSTERKRALVYSCARCGWSRTAFDFAPFTYVLGDGGA